VESIQIHTRSAGIADGTGINSLSIYGNFAILDVAPATSGGSIAEENGVSTTNLAFGNATSNVFLGQLSSFELIDNGSAISWRVFDTGGTEILSLTGASSTAFGTNFVAFQNRENVISTNSTAFDNLKVEQIPVPGALALMLGGLVSSGVWLRMTRNRRV
jgi:hypothetical protein